MARNLAAIRRVLLSPERMTDVSQIQIETTLFDSRQSCPLIIAPTGLNGLLWPDGDLALARVAAKADIPFVLSTAATSPLEDVAHASNSDKWFQLYVLENRRISEQLLARAGAAGYRVLMLTVDVPINGNRLRDQRNGFSFPLRIAPRMALDALLHPRWLHGIYRTGLPGFGNLSGMSDSSDPHAATALIQRAMDRSLTWNCIDWLRAHWHGPIVLKGILSSRDAIRAYECGIDGVVISNHGGRQLDCVPATMDALGTVVDSIAGRLTTLVDSGFRSGSDIVKAIALGAKGVLIGRPILYGLAAAGEAGASSVVELLRSEITRTMILAGYNNLSSLNRAPVLDATALDQCARLAPDSPSVTAGLIR